LPGGTGDFPAGPCIWFHGASIGEVNALGPLARLFAVELPVVFTSGTPAGLRAAGDFPALRFRDNPGFVRKGLSTARALVIAESELWPNLLMTAKRTGVPAFLANARVNRGTRRWLAAKGLLSEMLSAFREIYPKDEEEARKIVDLGAPRDRVVYLGGLKFDGLVSKDSARRVDYGFSDDQALVVFGSVRSGEFGPVVEAVATLDGFQVAIAPRHRNRLGRLLREMRRRGLSFRLRTDSGERGVLVLDTVGELRALYSVSDLAFVGGTLAPYGGHNILEPAALGVPVIIGPFCENQVSEADGLVAAGGCVRVRGSAELAAAARGLLVDKKARGEMGERARGFIEGNRGASRRIHERIMELL
jgi:3-deoxy-D-manno-octulosonic-acid transferase